MSEPPTLEARLSERDFGRTLVFSLPAPGAAPAHIRGIWLLGDHTGPLTLRFASRW